MVGGIPWEHLVNATGGAGENISRKHFAHFVTLSRTTSPAQHLSQDLDIFASMSTLLQKESLLLLPIIPLSTFLLPTVCRGQMVVVPYPTEFRRFYNLMEKQYGSAVGWAWIGE